MRRRKKVFLNIVVGGAQALPWKHRHAVRGDEPLHLGELRVVQRWQGRARYPNTGVPGRELGVDARLSGEERSGGSHNVVTVTMGRAATLTRVRASTAGQARAH